MSLDSFDTGDHRQTLGIGISLGGLTGGGPSPNFFLLENGVDEFLLESGSGVLQMEVP